MSYRVSAIVEKDENGYYVYCPELPGCQSQGDTFEEAMANIREAVDLYIDTLSSEERAELLSREIFSATLEVQVA